MSSREQILNRLRRHLPISEPPPELDLQRQRFDDPRQRFSEVLQSVGGACHVVHDLSAADRLVHELSVWQPERQQVTFVLGVGETNVPVEYFSNPHALEAIELAILPGSLAVAENAAVWVDDAIVSQRVLYFLSQHLVLVVPAANIVQTLHDAYDVLDVAERSFGCWISGPSKTADIEQSLVIGAHGARSLHVILVEHMEGTTAEPAQNP